MRCQEWCVVVSSFTRTDIRGRLFQIAVAAERKPRAPNEMLQRVAERRLAEADRRVLHGVCHWTRLARYWGPVCIALWVTGGLSTLSFSSELLNWFSGACLSRLWIFSYTFVLWIFYTRYMYKDNAEYISCSIMLMFLQYYVRIYCATLNDCHYFLIF